MQRLRAGPRRFGRGDRAEMLWSFLDARQDQVRKKARSTSASVRALDGSGSNDAGQTDRMPAASATSFDPGSTIHKRCGVAAAKNLQRAGGPPLHPCGPQVDPFVTGLTWQNAGRTDSSQRRFFPMG